MDEYHIFFICTFANLKNFNCGNFKTYKKVEGIAELIPPPSILHPISIVSTNGQSCFIFSSLPSTANIFPSSLDYFKLNLRQHIILFIST